MLPASCWENARVNPDLFLADVLSAPDRLARTLDAYGGADTPLGQLAVMPYERVVFIGMGSSRFAALTASALFRAAGSPPGPSTHRARYRRRPRPGTLAVGISASGTTPETVAALERHAGMSATVAVTNVPGSAIEAQPTSFCRSVPGLSKVASPASRSRQRSPCCTCSRGASAATGARGRRAPSGGRARASLRGARGGWLAEVAALVAGGELTQATAPLTGSPRPCSRR